MTKAELVRYEDRLTELARGLRGSVNGLSRETLRTAGGEASGNLSNAPLHLGDLASDMFAQETNLGVLEVEGQTLEQVNAALERVRQGTFGVCQECGGKIPKGRLEAVPYAPHCIACARELQDHGPMIEALGNL